jgi:hypothetical protein
MTEKESKASRGLRMTEKESKAPRGLRMTEKESKDCDWSECQRSRHKAFGSCGNSFRSLGSFNRRYNLAIFFISEFQIG